MALSVGALISIWELMDRSRSLSVLHASKKAMVKLIKARLLRVRVID
jgi:hypothetical protein